MPKKNLEEIGSNITPETIWTLPVEKVRNDKGKEEYIISIPEKMKKFLKLQEGDRLFWGERSDNVYEVRKATKQELQQYKIDISQDNALRQARMNQFYT
jgi:bifunctional DNA-binding transcriptional regulator/antitoxin component of YhaV-PrlF toxin-antitoxin module